MNLVMCFFGKAALSNVTSFAHWWLPRKQDCKVDTSKSISPSYNKMDHALGTAAVCNAQPTYKRLSIELVPETWDLCPKGRRVGLVPERRDLCPKDGTCARKMMGLVPESLLICPAQSGRTQKKSAVGWKIQAWFEAEAYQLVGAGTRAPAVEIVVIHLTGLPSTSWPPSRGPAPRAPCHCGHERHRRETTNP